jgi:hypothetical protein
MRELEDLRAFFLTDVDPETRADNEQRIKDWEQSLRVNRAFAEWQALDITQDILRQAKQTYLEASTALATNRALTDDQRARFWASQDASLWIVSLISKDAAAEIATIESEVRHALSATK